MSRFLIEYLHYNTNINKKPQQPVGPSGRPRHSGHQSVGFVILTQMYPCLTPLKHSASTRTPSFLFPSPRRTEGTPGAPRIEAAGPAGNPSAES